MNFLKRRLIKGKTWLAYHRNSKMLRMPHIMHPLFDAPKLPIRFLKNEISLDDAALDRICAAYLKAEANESANDAYTGLVENNLSFTQCLKNRDFAALRRIFSNLFHGELLTGVGHTDKFVSKNPPYDRNYFSLCVRDNVLSLAEALSVKCVPSNHMTSLQEYIQSTNGDLEGYIDKIESVLGHSVSAPDVGKPPVAIIGKHAVSPDSLILAYIMHRIQQLGFKADSPLLEIGGGFGTVARYAYLKGFRSFTSIDLPYVAAIQAAFLFATIGPDKVSLFGEALEAPVKILPSTHKESIQGSFDLVLNMNSLPGINVNEVTAYLEMTRAKAKYFLSVNRELRVNYNDTTQHVIVSEMAAKMGGFKLLHRNLYWMRQGHVEELYQVQ